MFYSCWFRINGRIDAVAKPNELGKEDSHTNHRHRRLTKAISLGK
jgi:hypothetical protein